MKQHDTGAQHRRTGAQNSRTSLPRRTTALLVMTMALVGSASTSATVAAQDANAEAIVPGRFNPGVDNPDFTLAADGSLLAMHCGSDGLPSCSSGPGFYPSLSEYPIISLEVASDVADVEGHRYWDGGAYDDVVHGREWNSGPGAAAMTLPADRLGISTTAADGVCPDYGYVQVPYPYLGSNAGSPWGHGGNSNCRPVAAAQTDLGPEFTGPAINWLLTNYLAGGVPPASAPIAVDQALGLDLFGADADLRNAAVVYAYHLLSPASVRTGATAVRSTLPFGLPVADFVPGPNFGNAVGATAEQIARIQTVGELLAHQAMRSARWGPYQAMLQWQGDVVPTTVGATATIRVYVGGCGPSGLHAVTVECAPTNAGSVPRQPIPDGGVYGVARPGATWNTDNGIGLVRAPAPTSSNGASILAVRDSSCPDIPAGWTCDDGFASFAVTIEHPGHDTFSFASGAIADWEPEMWASPIGQDAGFASGTVRSVSATLDFELDQPVFVNVRKRSSDPTIAVTGATFQLDDAGGAVVGEATTDAAGTSVFGPIDTALHPVPYSVRETTAPVGLQRIEGDQIVGESPYTYSTDATDPTTFVVTDAPVTASLRIHKVLSDATAEPQDMSGFAFSATRVADHQHAGVLTTQADGTTASVAVAAGTYDICETALPPWATAIVEAVGCQQLVVDGSGVDLLFVFTNPIVRPEAATQLSSPAAGAGDTVVESVWTRHWQTAGRVVTVSAALYGHTHGEPASTAVCDATTQATPQVVLSFTAAADEQVTSLPPMTIPDLVGLDFYAAGTIVDQQTGALVGVLPCGDVGERVVVPRMTTTAPAVVAPGTVMDDRYVVSGLPTDLNWNAVAHFSLVASATGTCGAPTTAVGSLDEPIASEGAGTTSGGVTVPSAAMLYRFEESIAVTVTRPDHPGGWTLSPPGGSSEHVTFVSKPQTCAAEESSPAPLVVTHASSAMLSALAAEPSIDTATVSGFGIAALDPAVWKVQLVIGLYRHDPSTDPTTWTCAGDNLVASHAAIDITGDGTYTTDGLVSYPTGVALSNQAQLIGMRTRADSSVESFETTPSGCREPDETQWVPAITTHVTTPSPAAGANDSDIATVVGVPTDFSGTIRLDIFRFVPGGSVQLADACQPAMLGATLVYSFTGPGDHVSPDYAISAQEVAGVQYVNQETLLTNDGRELAVERCATAAEVVTITRPLPPGRLTKTT